MFQQFAPKQITNQTFAAVIALHADAVVCAVENRGIRPVCGADVRRCEVCAEEARVRLGRMQTKVCVKSHTNVAVSGQTYIVYLTFEWFVVDLFVVLGKRNGCCVHDAECVNECAKWYDIGRADDAQKLG